jgi:hypothetical protein
MIQYKSRVEHYREDLLRRPDGPRDGPDERGERGVPGEGVRGAVGLV